ncbi:hypothetical protein [Actinophytocola oryzae]|uniref:hypothetical protein n=1 Tax=Actinophytocola oryzae TaxID=502181 RepID=UPI001FBB0DEB|nr:hypothetical protein [Actinophytocola oryzae]
MADDVRSADKDRVPAHVAESYELVAALQEAEARWAASLAARLTPDDDQPRSRRRPRHTNRAGSDPFGNPCGQRRTDSRL